MGVFHRPAFCTVFFTLARKVWDAFVCGVVACSAAASAPMAAGRDGRIVPGSAGQPSVASCLVECHLIAGYPEVVADLFPHEVEDEAPS